MARRDLALALFGSALILAVGSVGAEGPKAPGGAVDPPRSETPVHRDVIPVPVIPDKMAVPAPTVEDVIKKPGEAPAVQSGDHPSIPPPEEKPITPPIPGRNK